MKNTTIVLSVMIILIILSQDTLVNASTTFDINKNDLLSNFEFKFSVNFPYNPTPNEIANVSILYSISYNSSIPGSQMYPFKIDTLIINLNSPTSGLLTSINLSSVLFSKNYALQQYGITTTTLLVSPELLQTSFSIQILVYMSYKLTASNTTLPLSFFLSSNTPIYLNVPNSLGEILFTGIIALTILVTIIFLIGLFVDRYKLRNLMKRIRNQ